MSHAAQNEVDWAGIDVAPPAVAAPPADAVNPAGSAAEKYLTDEEILGISPSGTDSQRGSSNKALTPDEKKPSPQESDGAPATAEQNGAAGEMPAWMQTVAGDPTHRAEAEKLWREHQAFRASFSTPDEARAIKELFPGGAQEAQSLRSAAHAVDQLDAAIYSGDARAQSEVVAELARANPAAFRQLFSEAAKVLAGLGQAPPEVQPEVQLKVQPQPASNQTSADQNSRIANRDSQVTNRPSPSPRAGESPAANSQPPQFDPAAYAAFERSTNDTVARDVRTAVSDTLSRVLPEGIAEGAARRIGDDIFNEIHRTLAADRTLSEQIGEILRGSSRESTANGWRFGTAEQQRVASLLAGRAKQIVPGVARRVVGEWTSSVLGASRSKAARQASAAARVDIAAPGGSLDSTPLRPMSNREIDYASMSDDEILGM